MNDVDFSGFMPEDEDDDRYRRAKREFEEKVRGLEWFPGLVQMRTLFRLMLDKNEPWHRRSLAGAGVLYLVVPLDCYPDFLPAGLVDDLAVVISITLNLSGVMDEAGYENSD